MCTLEALLVVEGELSLHVQDVETRVATGRSALFAGDRPDAYQNQGTTPVVFLLTGTNRHRSLRSPQDEEAQQSADQRRCCLVELTDGPGASRASLGGVRG
jgi:uncharacterized cupin superfamily protein